jgi:hypothetical protein
VTVFACRLGFGDRLHRFGLAQCPLGNCRHRKFGNRSHHHLDRLRGDCTSPTANTRTGTSPAGRALFESIDASAQTLDLPGQFINGFDQSVQSFGKPIVSDLPCADIVYGIPLGLTQRPSPLRRGIEAAICAPSAVRYPPRTITRSE